MLIGIAVALNAIIEIADAFLDVLAANVVRCVLVAAIAGVAAVVVSNMAGHAAGIVVAIKLEIFAVIERRRCPLILVVALAAVAGNLPVQRVGRRFVARLALLERRLLQQGMIEMLLRPETLHACVVAMAGHAVLVDQLLVERRRGERLGDGFACCRQMADLGRLMAGNTALRRRSEERRMAGEAVRLQLLVAGDQLARPDHQVRINESQNRNHDQIGGQNKFEDAAHTQPQNKKILMM